jgi:hypothetical protein
MAKRNTSLLVKVKAQFLAENNDRSGGIRMELDA